MSVPMARALAPVWRFPISIVAAATLAVAATLWLFWDGLSYMWGSWMNVPEDKRFVSFDGYRHAMDALRPGDVVILATPPAFRWVHFTYAIEKKLNVFMEKP